MKFRPDYRAANERPRDYGKDLRALVDFMKADGQWEKITPVEAEQHRATLRVLRQDQARDYPDQSLGQAAEAIIARLQSETERANLKAVGDMVTVPRLGNGEWEVVKVDHSSRSYFLADPRDRRSTEKIVNAILSGEERDGVPIGHEVDWDELTKLAA